MKLPTLYKRTSAGATEQWSIWTEDNLIVTEHGQVDGKLIRSEDRVLEGKNLGKANATTATEQAEKEAQARWTKKVERNGYVEDQARAAAGETDQEGGIAPMLAKPHEDVVKKLAFPCLLQRKYNGVRCIAVYDSGTGKVTLWSRKREAMVVPVPHIIEAVEKLLAGSPVDVILDGELYVHGWSLQKIASFVRQKKTPKEGFERIEYHVYDMPSHDGTNAERDVARETLLLQAPLPLRCVPSFEVGGVNEAWQLHDDWVQEGYEGAIARNKDAKYQPGRRSPDLQKFKRFDETEFTVIDSRLGRGKYAGIPVLACVTAEDKEFECNPPGTLEERAAVDRQAVVGKKLTVKHFGWTDSKLPAFPVGVVIRDYE